VTRADVEEKWMAFAEERMTATEVHAWADQRIREVGHEPLAIHGLQNLHGLSAPPFRGSSDEVLRGLADWQAECVAYDRDPDGWSRERMQRAMTGLGFK
jgi:hypothetical protein